VSHIPVEQLAYDLSSDSVPRIRIAGVLYEAHPYGQTLERRREIITRVGSATIMIRDTVHNFGPVPMPLMVLYHFNFGYPLLCPTTEVVASGSPEPRDPAGMPWTSQFGEPRATAVEAVYYRTFGAAEDTLAKAMVLNRALDLGVVVHFDRRSLPELVEWREPMRSMYVLGLEPANCRVAGRARERQAGRLHVLEPGARADFQVEVEIARGERLEKLRAALVATPEDGAAPAR
jgi:hypothetical protein